MDGRTAPRMARGAVASWQAHVAKLGEALKAARADEQELAAPDRAVAAGTGAIERDADHRTAHAMLGHAADDVRMVMLHRHARDYLGVAALLRIRRRRIVGMSIMRDELGSE